MDDVDEVLAQAGDVVGGEARRAVELVVEDEEERHGVGAQVQFGALCVGEAVGGQEGDVPGAVPVKGLAAGHQFLLPDPVEVAVAGAVEIRARAQREGQVELGVLRHGSSIGASPGAWCTVHGAAAGAADAP
ncbi:hypothetical protein ACFVVX_12005 [Kitasatospora sp. NPDC058170]|uniref:hypothetical protein n=1 Tax=Kitasatospora sp. NPDC058170 TaxID=3346364 RepID=UPI0036D85674